jgi:hypothetical protein
MKLSKAWGRHMKLSKVAFTGSTPVGAAPTRRGSFPLSSPPLRPSSSHPSPLLHPWLPRPPPFLRTSPCGERLHDAEGRPWHGAALLMEGVRAAAGGVSSAFCSSESNRGLFAAVGPLRLARCGGGPNAGPTAPPAGPQTRAVTARGSRSRAGFACGGAGCRAAADAAAGAVTQSECSGRVAAGVMV